MNIDADDKQEESTNAKIDSEDDNVESEDGIIVTTSVPLAENNAQQNFPLMNLVELMKNPAYQEMMKCLP
eukprot:CAMPEP_0171480658 /NCGR_PEP_ID=MMETSP0946-20130122/6213_1 /TAXON_ID=109269 /ORGANISM="Vaucheria litorea, Strain CCMP2940" /LENGTH=69 /DNA_ID=CAMNT_0012011945 /DNA_START=1 /DNA_END=206 /DNA_ORIENTATION=+